MALKLLDSDRSHTRTKRLQTPCPLQHPASGKAALSAHPPVGLAPQRGLATPLPSEGPQAALGDKTVFCCSRVELESFEVYFLSLQNNGVFDISHHSISALEILESHRTVRVDFVWEKKHHFVSVGSQLRAVCFSLSRLRPGSSSAPSEVSPASAVA